MNIGSLVEKILYEASLPRIGETFMQDYQSNQLYKRFLEFTWEWLELAINLDNGYIMNEDDIKEHTGTSYVRYVTEILIDKEAKGFTPDLTKASNSVYNKYIDYFWKQRIASKIHESKTYYNGE